MYIKKWMCMYVLFQMKFKWEKHLGYFYSRCACSFFSFSLSLHECVCSFLAFLCPIFISSDCFNHSHIWVETRLLVWMTEWNLMDDIFNTKRFAFFFFIWIWSKHCKVLLVSVDSGKKKKSIKDLMEFIISFEHFRLEILRG